MNLIGEGSKTDKLTWSCWLQEEKKKNNYWNAQKSSNLERGWRNFHWGEETLHKGRKVFTRYQSCNVLTRTRCGLESVFRRTRKWHGMVASEIGIGSGGLGCSPVLYIKSHWKAIMILSWMCQCLKLLVYNKIDILLAQVGGFCFRPSLDTPMATMRKEVCKYEVELT